MRTLLASVTTCTLEPAATSASASTAVASSWVSVSEGTSQTVPPTKSTDRLSPRVNSAPSEIRISTPDMISRRRLMRGKSKSIWPR
jgi:hypothetical protein